MDILFAGFDFSRIGRQVDMQGQISLMSAQQLANYVDRDLGWSPGPEEGMKAVSGAMPINIKTSASVRGHVLAVHRSDSIAGRDGMNSHGEAQDLGTMEWVPYSSQVKQGPFCNPKLIKHRDECYVGMMFRYAVRQSLGNGLKDDNRIVGF